MIPSNIIALGNVIPGLDESVEAKMAKETTQIINMILNGNNFLYPSCLRTLTVNKISPVNLVVQPFQYQLLN
jgi:hypothetical protein